MIHFVHFVHFGHFLKVPKVYKMYKVPLTISSVVGLVLADFPASDQFPVNSPSITGS